MRHLLLIPLSAFLTLPFVAVAEEQDSNMERDPYAVDRQTTDDQTETTFERTSDPQSEEATGDESEYSFEQTGERSETTMERDTGQDVTTQEASFEEQDTAEQDQSTGSERTRSTTVSADQQGQQQNQQQREQGGEPEVARAQFASDVQNREPVDEVSDSFSAGQDPLYFFTEINNGDGETITHVWKHDGEVMAEVPLQVGGSDSWRTWSSKELMPDWDGEWTVEVVDSQGNTLEEQSVHVEGGSQTRVQNVGLEQQSDTDQQDQQRQEAEFEQTSGQQQDTESDFEFEQTEGQEQGAETERTEGEDQQEDDWWQISDQQEQDQQQDDTRDTEERDW